MVFKCKYGNFVRDNYQAAQYSLFCRESSLEVLYGITLLGDAPPDAFSQLTTGLQAQTQNGDFGGIEVDPSSLQVIGMNTSSISHNLYNILRIEY